MWRRRVAAEGTDLRAIRPSYAVCRRTALVPEWFSRGKERRPLRDGDVVEPGSVCGLVHIQSGVSIPSELCGVDGPRDLLSRGYRNLILSVLYRVALIERQACLP
jgi:hypothetical protein